MSSAQGRPERGLNLAERLALRPTEAARAIGVSERTLRQLLPRIPHLREGGVVLIPVRALERWLEAEARAQGSAVDTAVAEILRDS